MKLTILILISFLAVSCISKFIPEVDESQELVVVEGLITDQPGSDTIKLYRSIPLGKSSRSNPLTGCSLNITDDIGNSFYLSEVKPGVYITDAEEVCGAIGRTYTLKIFTSDIESNNYSYESIPMEMKPVPVIDNLYYEKVLIAEGDKDHNPKEGCQVYLDTHDPTDNCSYYRWDFNETWEMRLPYDLPNKVCWVSSNSNQIMIRNTSVLSENRITGYPINFISNETDRLNVRYSMLVNQYSLSADEYVYWEKVQNVFQEVGSLYDITPASISSNIYCIENPNEKVLGYFSVSAKSSKRIFVDDKFSGVANLYLSCATDTIKDNRPIIGLGLYLWVIEDGSLVRPPYRILTNNLNCADCTTRGTKIKPSYWDNNK